MLERYLRGIAGRSLSSACCWRAMSIRRGCGLRPSWGSIFSIGFYQLVSDDVDIQEMWRQVI